MTSTTVPLDAAIAGAKSYLLDQSRQHFAEVRHTMTFPRRAGFRALREEQSSDVFARAVLGAVLLDIAELEDRDQTFRSSLLSVIHREADYVAQAKLSDRAGGWSYFPALSELPPDLDSLGAALFLFARTAPEYLPLCQEAIELALSQARPDGSLGTWLISDNDSQEQREAMRRGIKRYWGRDIAVDVCARFFLALWAAGPDRYRRVVDQGCRYLLSQQQPGGSWTASWYWGQVYVTSLCMQLLAALEVGPEAIARAEAFLLTAQHDNGGWGLWESVPLDTALAVWSLAQRPTPVSVAAARRGVAFLLDHYTGLGYWNPSPWIKMEVGRARGRVTHTLSYQSETLTTAFCLRGLMAARAL